MERIVVPTRDGYDRWSDVYDGDGNPLVLLEEPHVARLLGDVRGLSVWTWVAAPAGTPSDSPGKAREYGR